MLGTHSEQVSIPRQSRSLGLPGLFMAGRLNSPALRGFVRKAGGIMGWVSRLGRRLEGKSQILTDMLFGNVLVR